MIIPNNIGKQAEAPDRLRSSPCGILFDLVQPHRRRVLGGKTSAALIHMIAFHKHAISL